MTKDELNKVMKSLSLRRPVFHSEADFQHELAIEYLFRSYGATHFGAYSANRFGGHCATFHNDA